MSNDAKGGKSRLRKIGFFALKLVISSALLYYVFNKSDIGKVITLLKGINPLTFIGAVLIYIFAQFISSIRWMLLLPQGFSLWRLFLLYLMGSFFSTFLPGLIGGDAVKAYYLYKETGRGTEAFASVFMDRYVGYSSLMIIGITAFPFGIAYFKGSWVEWLLPLMVLSFFSASLVIFGLRIGKRFKFLGNFYEYFHSYRKKKAVIAKTLLLSSVVQATTIFAVYLISMGLGQSIPLLTFFVFMPIIVSIASLPISISGIGIREAAFVLLFGFVGVSPEAATAISFAWFLAISIGGLTGLYEYLRHKTYAS